MSFENLCHYDYTNGSSDSSDSSDTSCNGAFELLRKENRSLPPVNYNLFILVGIRDSKEERKSVGPIGKKERKIIEERREEREEKGGTSTNGGGENLEGCCQSQVGASSSARPAPQQIDPATLTRLHEHITKAYKETFRQEEELKRIGKLPMGSLPWRGSKRRELPAA